MRIQVVSSNISEIEYDETLKELSVWFLNKKTDTEHYVYSGVKPGIFGELMLADSKGKYFFSKIRNSYEVKKVE